MPEDDGELRDPGVVPEEKPQFGERDEAIAKLQTAVWPEGRGAWAQRKGSPQFSKRPGAGAVSAGRQIGFELLGYGLFNMAFGLFFNMLRYLAFPGHLARSNELVDKILETGSLEYFIDYMMHKLLFSVISTVLSALLLILLLTATGKTPGGILGGYRMVNIDSGAPVGFARASAYFLVYSLAGLAFFPAVLIWVSPSFDSESGWHRGWLYRMIGTIAVDTKATYSTR